MNEIKVLLGKRIKELRKRLNLSQQDLAEKINIDQRNLSNIECGISFPSKTLYQLSEALNVPLSELFNFEHLNISSIEMKQFISEEIENLEEKDIITIYRFIKSLI